METSQWVDVWILCIYVYGNKSMSRWMNSLYLCLRAFSQSVVLFIALPYNLSPYSCVYVFHILVSFVWDLFRLFIRSAIWVEDCSQTQHVDVVLCGLIMLCYLAQLPLHKPLSHPLIDSGILICMRPWWIIPLTRCAFIIAVIPVMTVL